MGRRGVCGVGMLHRDLVSSAEEGYFYRHQCGLEDALPDEGSVLYLEKCQRPIKGSEGVPEERAGLRGAECFVSPPTKDQASGGAG